MRVVKFCYRGLALPIAISVLAACGGGGVDPGSDGQIDEAPREQAMALTPPTNANVKGMFGPLQSWPLVAVHGVLVPDGRILSFGTMTDGKQTGFFNYDIWNPADGTHLTLPNSTAVDLFCSSPLVLPGGTAIAISGGDNWLGSGTSNTGNNSSTLLDVATRTLTRGANMNRARWYATSTMLLNGELYIQGGTGGTDRPEIRDANGNYRLLTGANTEAFGYYYPHNFLAPDGRVFGIESAGRMYYVDTAGSGSVTTLTKLPSAVSAFDTGAAMFAPGRILQYGGNSNQAYIIDIGSGTPVVTQTSSMLRQRRASVATVLADGKVVVTGGSGVWNEMTNVSYEAEIWNPLTGQWTVGASMVKPRLYHNNALLLPDATVLVFGGGAPAPSGGTSNLNAEIYYPPYLFNSTGFAGRPQIDSAPTVVDTGRTVQVEVTSGRPIERVTFVKSGSATHGFNMDQRFVDLPFNTNGSTLSVQIPARASDVPPGIWMMFVINDAGVPSQAKLMRMNVATSMNVNTRPTIANPGNQSSPVGQSVSLQVGASDPNNDKLSYSASGLPAGLTINSSTGKITGTPTTTGTKTVVLAVSDGFNSDSVTVTWAITSSSVLLNPPEPPPPSIAGTTATFTVSGTGSGLSYRWDFGDGTVSAWSANPSADHSYAQAGVYYVSVTARNSQGTEERQTLTHSVYLPTTAGKPTMSSDLLLEPRSGGGMRLWVVNPDNNSVTIFDAVTRTKVKEIAVGTAPRTLALAPDGKIWVVNKASATISVISPGTLSVANTVKLPRASQPYGIAMAKASTSALVTLEGTGKLLRIKTDTRSITGTTDVGPNPRHLSVAADGKTAWISRYITPPLPGESTLTVTTTVSGPPVGAELIVVDSSAMSVQRTVVLAHSDKPDAENQGRGIPNYLGAAAISPDGTQAFVPSKQDNVLRGEARDGLALNFQNSVRAISSRVKLAQQAEDLAARIDHDNASVASAAAFDPLGVYLFVALETSREVAVLDAHNRNEVMRIDVGRAPQGLLVAPDRRTLYVHNFMDRSVSIFDLTQMIERGVSEATLVATKSTVGTEKLTSNVLRGKQFFYDARDTRLSRDRYMSCASCHNDGGHDGRVWDLTSQGEGLRNTVNLRGRGGAQGHLHWSNNFDEVQDFEGQIRTLAGGTGLMTDAQFNYGTRSQPLGDKKAGVSADLDALAAYVKSLNKADPSPFRTSSGALTSLATEGKEVFKALACAGCHAGAAFTNSGVNNPQDIGTLTPASGKRLNGPLTGIDVPTLRDVWATAPYLHNGSATTLEAAVQAHNGVTVNSADLQRLAAYLREIGSEEASAPGAGASGGTGLAGSYFNNITLSGTPVLGRNEMLDFDWGSKGPGSGVNNDKFSARWTGYVVIPTTGSYRFRTVASDGVRLWIDSNQAINRWTNNGSKAEVDTARSLNFVAGQRVPIKLEYYENTGDAIMKLKWSKPGTSGYTSVPIANLVPN